MLSVQDKQGRSGPLTFVTVGRAPDMCSDGQVVRMDEQQDIVYRPAVPPTGPAVPPTGPAADAPASPGGGDGRGAVRPRRRRTWAIDVSPTLLFRFSALTYNAHRIHYDRDYARDTEGYPGLLTHGPLQALAMAEAARAAGYPPGPGDVVFDYRLVSPLFDHQGLVARASPGPAGVDAAIRDHYGRQTATGTLRRAE